MRRNYGNWKGTPLPPVAIVVHESEEEGAVGSAFGFGDALLVTLSTMSRRHGKPEPSGRQSSPNQEDSAVETCGALASQGNPVPEVGKPLALL